METNYAATYRACATASVSQAAIVNLSPLIFVPLQRETGYWYAMLGALVFVNFFTQLLVDLICSPLLDRFGFRLFAVMGHMFASAGLVLFALCRWLPDSSSAYVGFVVCTVIFSIGGGMLEVVTSPIINSLPAKEKSATMSLMHGFYCWGQMGVVLLTTLFMYVFGTDAWPFAYMIWAALPFVNGLAFTRCPMAPPLPAEKRSSLKSVARNPLFIVLILVILCSGATELTISQWTSAFAEKYLMLPKVAGDIGGMCLFAVMMGIGRTINGIKGGGKNLRGLMISGGVLAAVCYLTVAVASNAALGLAACALCGLGVSLMWPGALSLAVEAFPTAGSWMMAFMAAAGDIGCSIGPQLAGVIADSAGLRTGIMVSAVFPAAIVVFLLIERVLRKRNP